MTRVYAESSAALRWLLRHNEGNRVQEVLMTAGDVVTSRLTSLEVARTLQRLASTKQISPSERASCWAAYQNAARHWKVYAVTDEILERAADPFPVEPVRSPDAIHLATILACSKAIGPLPLLSTDDRIRDNATALGLEVLP
jgi:predicted nucleic acid-binding protein